MDFAFNLDNGSTFGSVGMGSEDMFYGGDTFSPPSESGKVVDITAVPGNTESKSADISVQADDLGLNPVNLGIITDNTAKGIVESDELLYESKEISHIAGFSYETDPVQKQFGEFENVQYPCVYITADPSKYASHLMNMLHNLVNRETDVFTYPIYLDYNGQLIELGSIDGRSLRTLILDKGFSSWNVYVFDEEKTCHKDEMRLAFCSAL